MSKKFYIIAGEESGDNIGYKLIDELVSRDDSYEFFGVGGDKMKLAGADSKTGGFERLFHMKHIMLFGFLEVLPHIFKIRKLIKETVKHIKEVQPDYLITIDSPGFNFRVAKKIRELVARGKLNTKIIHYVAPTIWAYKEERANKVKEIYDHQLLILPFEKPYFDKYKIESTYVGHPVMEDSHEFDGYFREDFNIDDNHRVVGISAGSRKGEVKRLLPIFLKAVGNFKDVSLVFLTTKNMEHFVSEMTADLKIPAYVISDDETKAKARDAIDIAITKSGTNTLEFSRDNVPIIVAYKVNPITAWLVRRMVKIKYVNLVNLIMGREVIPEMIQGDCSSKKIADKMLELGSATARMEQTDAAAEACEIMGYGARSATKNAADAILGIRD